MTTMTRMWTSDAISLQATPVYGITPAFRAPPTQAASGPKQPDDPAALSAVDWSAGMIRGASGMQIGEAIGHGARVDATTIAQLAAGINASSKGVKVRFTHAKGNDGLGTQLAKAGDARVVDDKCVVDLTMLQSAKRAPKGDFYSYIMALAEETPEDFGLSASIDGKLFWKLDDGAEMGVKDPSLAMGCDQHGQQTFARPDNAVDDLPVIRITRVKALDMVDDPAANRTGLFSANEDRTAAVIEQLDRALNLSGLDAPATAELVSRYLANRTHLSDPGQRRAAGDPSHPVTPGSAAASPDPNQETHMLSKDQLKKLRTDHPGHGELILDLSIEGKTESEIVTAVHAATSKKLSDQNLTLSAQIDELNKLLAAAKTATPTTTKTDPPAKETTEQVDLAAKKIKDLELELESARKVAKLAGGSVKDPGALGDAGEQAPAGLDLKARCEFRWKRDAQLRKHCSNQFDAFYFNELAKEAETSDDHTAMLFTARAQAKRISDEEFAAELDATNKEEAGDPASKAS